MAKALGTSPEEEHRQGIHRLAKVGFTTSFITLGLRNYWRISKAKLAYSLQIPVHKK